MLNSYRGPACRAVGIALLLLTPVLKLRADTPEPPRIRIDDRIVPLRYRLDLTLRPNSAVFSGSVEIELRVQQPAQVLWLNRTGLTISKAELSVGGQKVTPAMLPGDEDFVGFRAPRTLAPGSMMLRLEFQGKVQTRSSIGIFHNQYRGDDYLFTQFEPLDARRAFPCFDQPNFKTPWQLTLHIPQALSAFANAQVTATEREGGGMKAVWFAVTKPLPSYLVAFAVGPLEIVDAGVAGKNKVPVRIVVARGETAQAKYAASVSADILTRLESYFRIPYPYSKSDQVAVPLSFGGAMENPGLVTYDADIILSPPGNDSLRRQQLYASVAAHELAHQWFGDYVTMAWWTDTWLNEAFATWMSSRLLADWKPEWETRAEDQRERNLAIREDTLVAARRINQPAETKGDIGNAFDAITYQKGGVVLRMFENFIGRDRFQRGVHDYLAEHQFGNARTEDFLAALSKVAGPEIAPAFSTFLNQAGVPLLTARLSCSSGQAPTLELSQRRLYPAGLEQPEPQVWQVPVCAAWGSGRDRHTDCTLLKQPTGTLALSANSCPAWVLPNAEEVGYYRVEYPAAMVDALLANQEQLSVAERVGLLGDVETAMNVGLTKPSTALGLVRGLRSSQSNLVMAAAVDLVDSIPTAFYDADGARQRAGYVREVFGERARELGWVGNASENDPTVQRLRRRLVPFVANRGEDEQLIAASQSLANKWLADRKAVPEDTAEAVLSTAVAHSGVSLYERVLAAAQSETNPTYKRLAFRSLASVRDADLIRRNFDLVLNTQVDPRYSVPLLLGPTRTDRYRDMPFEFVKDHFDQLARLLPSGVGTDYGANLPHVGDGFCSDQDGQRLESFFAPRIDQFKGGKRLLAQTVEQIHVCTATRQREQADLAAFLQRYRDSAAGTGAR